MKTNPSNPASAFNHARARNRSYSPFAFPFPFNALCIFLLLAAAPAPAQQSIVQTRHNLSVTGPGPVRATNEQRICVFCHTPHGSRTNAPLWNRRDSAAAYTPYNSPTLKASVGQPTGASKLCLSCHDGTIAMGDLVSEETTVHMSGSQTMPAGHGLIGTDLSNDHPISFSYMDSFAQLASRLNAPGGWDPRVKLDVAAQVQCTTCHDPHNNQYGRFMVMDNSEAALCRVCHRYDQFNQTAHASSTAQWSGTGENPWPHTDYHDVRTNACMNCHTSHHAGGPEELLTHAKEEDVCFTCHDGSVAQYNLEAVFNKTARHPVERTQGAHEGGESPLMSGDHVECADCHNPHRARRAAAVAPFVMGALEGVSGVDASGTPVSEAAYEYQVCFKCHNAASAAPMDAISRKIPSTDLTKAFAVSNNSYHPVVGAGKATDVPSLIAPMNTASQIYCTECHNNDQADPAVPGSSGPHGSQYKYLLKRDYQTGDNVGYSSTAYALCFGCHSEAVIMNDTTFPHKKHVQEKNTPCSVCHDPHGVDATKANAGNAHLINFDASVVSADPVQGRTEYVSTAPRAGECYLTCHGTPHVGLSYSKP